MTVVDLLKMHCLEDSYIVAGIGGQHNVVKRIDFLENPFPNVKIFMEVDEFIFTTFYNMKDDKQNRINLIQYMIDHGSAGIAIMPDLNLGGVIDQEILDLGNRNNFPVVYIPPNVRYSDIIDGYGLVKNSPAETVFGDTLYFDLMREISGFHQSEDYGALCTHVSEQLQLPLILVTPENSVYMAHSDAKITTLILAKFNEIRSLYRDNMGVPISIFVTKDIISIVSFHEKAAVITYIDHYQLQDSNIKIFQHFAPILLDELKASSSEKKKPEYKPSELQISENYLQNYLVVVKKDGIEKFLPLFEKHYAVYNYNFQLKYVVLVIHGGETSSKNIYKTFHELLEKVEPQLLIFSRPLNSISNFEDQLRLLHYVLPNLLFLKGIFALDELPLLYIMLFAPYDFKELLYAVLGQDFSENAKPPFLDTLRLYLIVNNLGAVSDLLGIHINSVKYQIHKCFQDFNVRSNLSELPALKLLTKLELMKVENMRDFGN